MRELRVEDALMYLDQVKMEFGNQPHIYNEFLDIMKTFKSQQIDTPGVIQRVSALFHGNKRLVLGFNTFLPEGYKIELPEGSGLAVYREPGRREAIQITWPGMAEHLAMQQANEANKAAGSSGGGEVKKPSVAAAPPPVVGQMAAALEGAKSAGPTAPSGAAASSGAPPAAGGAAPAASQPATTFQGQHVEFGHAINYVTTIKKRFASSPEIYRKFLEILHTYQKEQRGIKEVLDEVSTLFADHADLLKEFTYFLPDAVQGVAKLQLDIAAAKAEERMRKKQLAAAKEAQGGGAGGGASQGAQGTSNKQPLQREERVPAAHVKRVPFGATKARSENEETDIKKGVVYGVVSFDPVRPPRRNEPTPAQSAHIFGRPTTIPPATVTLNTNESDIFSKIKVYLDNKDEANNTKLVKKSSHYEFLKLLHLFGIGILSRDELIQLLRGLFGKSSVTVGGMKPHQLLSALEKIMAARGPASQSKKKSSSAPTTESDAVPVTPSYQPYSSDTIFTSNTGETELEKRVLNHKVLVKKGDKKMEDYDGVRWRRNVHEGVLVRVEDEMYEVDIAIERNSQTLKHLQPIAEEMIKLKSAEEKAGQPIGRLQYKLKPRTLNSIHIGAIARIYGDSGDEVIQHLIRNPLMVVPLIYHRMVEKDKEWRNAREVLVKEWKEELKAHFAGSLDIKDYSYKVDFEKSVSDKSLIEECQGTAEPMQLDIQDAQFHKDPNPEMALYQPYLSVTLPENVAHADIFKLISSVTSDESLARVWNNFIAPWFGLALKGDEPWFGLALKGDESAPATYTVGQHVKTNMGDGEILSVQDGKVSNRRYIVKFPFGVGYVRPNAILEALPPTETEGASAVDVAQFSVQGDNITALFGTKSMYISLRLYSCLATVMSHLKYSISAEEYDELLNLASEKGVDPAKYEAHCKKVTGASPRMHMFLNIPFLVKRCADALLQASDESDTILLSHLSQLQLKDLNLLRTLSLEKSNSAVYRIQMKSNSMIFNYLPPEMDLLTTAVSTSMEIEEPVGAAEPEAKRQKTEEMVE
ncbi:hypothetical protein ACHAXN_007213 [Cyclotella atomus]